MCYLLIDWSDSSRMPVKNNSLYETPFCVNICFEKTSELFTYHNTKSFGCVVFLKILNGLLVCEGLLTVSVSFARRTYSTERSIMLSLGLNKGRRRNDKQGTHNEDQFLHDQTITSNLEEIMKRRRLISIKRSSRKKKKDVSRGKARI